MTDAHRKADPTGYFGEGAPDQADSGMPLSYRGDTEQHFSRWAPGSAEGGADEGTAEHAPLIERPRATGPVGGDLQGG